MAEKQKTKRQHHVPRVYLKRFATTGKLWIYDKVSDRTFVTTPEQVAVEAYFYDIPDSIAAEAGMGEDFDVQFVEKRLSRMEADLDSLLTEVLTPPLTGTSATQRFRLGMHLNLQFLRSKTFRKMAHEVVEKFGQAIVDSLVAKNFPQDQDLTPTFRFGDKGIQVLHGLYCTDPKNLERLTDVLLKHHFWMLGVNRTIQPLYTSDHPVIRHANASIDGLPWTGFTAPGSEIFYPLSPKHALILRERCCFSHDAPFHGKSVELDPEWIDRLNRLQVQKCHRYVFCDRDAFEQARGVRRRFPGLCQVERDRVHIDNASDTITTTFLE